MQKGGHRTFVPILPKALASGLGNWARLARFQKPSTGGSMDSVDPAADGTGTLPLALANMFHGEISPLWLCLLRVRFCYQFPNMLLLKEVNWHLTEAEAAEAFKKQWARRARPMGSHGIADNWLVRWAKAGVNCPTNSTTRAPRAGYPGLRADEQLA
ncbi:hypothetical protein VTN49DRAFT_6426 [Thermomyces lanuginosus]|uniref:uncharacterized protein n=1 Tax=Thermomyces lanuginosus TaxID=5541 RepID=UPI0037445506